LHAYSGNPVDPRQVIVTDAQHSRAVPQVDEINDRLQDRIQR